MSSTIEQQCTIDQEVVIKGIGLHTGKPVTMHAKPAPVDHGICFHRCDVVDTPIISASLSFVSESSRGTNLANEKTQIHTVEHVLAACYAAQLDNILFSLDGPEPPALDGSAHAFLVELIKGGSRKQDAPRIRYTVAHPVTYGDESGTITILPHDKLTISYTLQYENPHVGYQHLSLDVTPEIAAQELLRARTFCLQNEVDSLHAAGQALGGSLENAVVVGSQGLMNADGLRYPDEFVRHKMADLLGDFFLLGRRIHGKIIAIRSGHTHNVRLLKELQRTRSLVSPHEVLDVGNICEILPHRFPFLLVDRIVQLQVGVYAVGIKNVSMNEPFFTGHFPGKPVMPGVLMVEALAQVAGVCILSMPEHRGRLPFFTGLDGIKFRRPIVPGDQVQLEIEVKKIKGVMGHVAARALVENKTAVEGILKFTVM